jgi:hypothetical protein
MALAEMEASGFSELPLLMCFNLLVHRLSRHAIRYKGDLRTSSTAVLDRPMSASFGLGTCLT